MAKPFIGLVLLILLALTGEAHAYLDPGTGSMLLQAAVGSVAAGLVVIRLYWHRLKGFFARDGAAVDATGDEASAKKEG